MQVPNNILERVIARRVALRVIRLKKNRPMEFRFRFVNGLAHLPRNADTVLAGNPGVYTLRFYERKSGKLFGAALTADYTKIGHAVLGPELPSSSSASVMRRVSNVSGARIERAIGGWVSGWLAIKPEDFSDGIEEVAIDSSNGWHLPAWQLQPKAKSTPERWVIHVHGRGATAAETARNFEQFEQLGFTNLSISYRNDGTALRGGKVGRGALGLGTSEWIDLEAAVAYAKANGAVNIVVFGWSYGAAISLQFAKHSTLAADVDAYIFDSPVISWRETLTLQAALSNLPVSWVSLGEAFLRNAKSAKTVGLESPIDLDEFTVEKIAQYFDKPALLLHSNDDGYIPISPCFELADALPDTVHLVEFHGARHCKLYNYDKPKYQASIAKFLAEINAG